MENKNKYIVIETVLDKKTFEITTDIVWQDTESACKSWLCTYVNLCALDDFTRMELSSGILLLESNETIIKYVVKHID